MRDISEVRRAAVILRGHLGPLFPAKRPAVIEEEGQQPLRAIAPAEVDEGSGLAQFVRRVVLPGAAAFHARQRLAPRALEFVEDDIVREVGEVAAGLDADGRRGRIEIAEVRRAGDVVDVMRFDGKHDRGMEVAGEFIAALRETRRRVGIAELFGQPCRIFQSAQREEIVPVRMHRFRGVTLVAD